VISVFETFMNFENFDLGVVTFKPFLNLFSAEIKQIYTLSDNFSAGFGAGLDFLLIGASGSGSGVKVKANGSEIAPYGKAAFTYKFNTPFSVNAGLKAAYNIIHTSSSGGRAGLRNRPGEDL